MKTALQKIDEEINEVIVNQSGSASCWLVNALKTAMKRDPLDVAYDSALMAELLQTRRDAILADTEQFLKIA